MDKIKELLDKTLGKEISKELYNPRLKQNKKYKGLMPGDVYTYEEFIALKDDTLVHLYYEEEGDECENDFGKLCTNDGDTQEWDINGWPIPLDELEPGQIMENCPNDTHTFTIKKVVHNSEQDFEKNKQNGRIAKYILDEMQEVLYESQKTNDKIKLKELKARLKELNKVLSKFMNI